MLGGKATFVSRVHDHFLGGGQSMPLGYDSKAWLAKSSYSHGPGLPPHLRLSRRAHGTVLKSLLSLAGPPGACGLPEGRGCVQQPWGPSWSASLGAARPACSYCSGGWAWPAATVGAGRTVEVGGRRGCFTQNQRLSSPFRC